MIINAYICTDDENVVSKNLIFAARFDGTLREPSSILKPSITFEYSGNPSTWTHFGIADFARMYFITDIISVGKNLWQISGRVDVLYTYRGNRADRDGIYGLTGIVVRNEDETDALLTDTAIPIQNNTTLTVLSCGRPDINNFWTGSENIMKSTGDDRHYRYIQMVALPPLDSNDALITTGYPQAFYCMEEAVYHPLIQNQLSQVALFNNKTLSDYIMLNYWLPFEPKITGNIVAKLQRSGFASDFDFGGAGIYVIDYGNKISRWYCDITCQSLMYKNFAPYRDVYIQFMPFGRIKLDNSVIFSGASTTAKVYFKVVSNVMTGDSTLYYGMDRNNINIFLAQSNVKIDLPITTQTTNYGQIAAGLAQTVIAGAVMAETGGAAALGAVGGMVSGASNAVNASRGSSAGGISSKFIDSDPVVLVYDNTTNAAARNNAILGQPLYESRALHTIHGYAEITHVHFDGINATAAEKEELKALFAAGVIFDNETP